MIRANKNATALCPCLIFYPATFVIRSVGVVIKQVLNGFAKPPGQTDIKTAGVKIILISGLVNGKLL